MSCVCGGSRGRGGMARGMPCAALTWRVVLQAGSLHCFLGSPPQPLALSPTGLSALAPSRCCHTVLSLPSLWPRFSHPALIPASCFPPCRSLCFVLSLSCPALTEVRRQPGADGWREERRRGEGQASSCLSHTVQTQRREFTRSVPVVSGMRLLGGAVGLEGSATRTQSTSRRAAATLGVQT